MTTEEEKKEICPSCRSEDITYEVRSEYTGGGYADNWYVFECKQCGNIWRSQEKTAFY